MLGASYSTKGGGAAAAAAAAAAPTAEAAADDVGWSFSGGVAERVVSRGFFVVGTAAAAEATLLFPTGEDAAARAVGDAVTSAAAAPEPPTKAAPEEALDSSRSGWPDVTAGTAFCSVAAAAGAAGRAGAFPRGKRTLAAAPPLARGLGPANDSAADASSCTLANRASSSSMASSRESPISRPSAPPLDSGGAPVAPAVEAALPVLRGMEVGVCSG